MGAPKLSRRCVVSNRKRPPTAAAAAGGSTASKRASRFLRIQSKICRARVPSSVGATVMVTEPAALVQHLLAAAA